MNGGANEFSDAKGKRASATRDDERRAGTGRRRSSADAVKNARQASQKEYDQQPAPYQYTQTAYTPIPKKRRERKS